MATQTTTPPPSKLSWDMIIVPEIPWPAQKPRAAANCYYCNLLHNLCGSNVLQMATWKKGFSWLYL